MISDWTTTSGYSNWPVSNSICYSWQNKLLVSLPGYLASYQEQFVAEIRINQCFFFNCFCYQAKWTQAVGCSGSNSSSYSHCIKHMSQHDYLHCLPSTSECTDAPFAEAVATCNHLHWLFQHLLASWASEGGQLCWFQRTHFTIHCWLSNVVSLRITFGLHFLIYVQLMLWRERFSS